MPKHTFKISSSAAGEELDDSGFYAGDTPPNGVYKAVIKKIWLKETNNKSNEAFSVLAEIREPASSSKNKYNGAGVFDWLNITDAGAPFINRLFASVGLPKLDKVLQTGFVTDDEDPPNVTKIGAKRVTGEWPCRIATKIDDRGSPKVARYLPPADDDDEADEAAEEVDGVSLDEGDEEAAEEAVDEGAYTEEELTEMELSDLKAIASEFEIELTPKARKATIINAILEYQESVEEGEGGEEAADEASEEAGDALSEEELSELTLVELKEYADSIELEYPPKITSGKLVTLILNSQAEEPADEEAAEEDGEESGDAISEDDLKEMSQDELKEYLVDTLGGTLPKPPIKTKLIKAILDAQEAESGEPPF